MDRVIYNESFRSLGPGIHSTRPREQLEQFIAEIRAAEAPDFTVKTTGNAPDLYIIKCIEPLAPNLPALGFDVGSEANRRQAAERAMRTGNPAVTKMIRLVQSDKNLHGLLCYVPVYRTVTIPKTIEERERTCLGWTYMPIISELALANVSSSTDHALDIEVFDDSDLTTANLIYDADNHLSGRMQQKSRNPTAAQVQERSPAADLGQQLVDPCEHESRL